MLLLGLFYLSCFYFYCHIKSFFFFLGFNTWMFTGWIYLWVYFCTLFFAWIFSVINWQQSFSLIKHLPPFSGTDGTLSCLASYFVCNSVFSSIIAIAGDINVREFENLSFRLFITPFINSEDRPWPWLFCFVYIKYAPKEYKIHSQVQ